MVIASARVLTLKVSRVSVILGGHLVGIFSVTLMHAPCPWAPRRPSSHSGHAGTWVREAVLRHSTIPLSVYLVKVLSPLKGSVCVWWGGGLETRDCLLGSPVISRALLLPQAQPFCQGFSQNGSFPFENRAPCVEQGFQFFSAKSLLGYCTPVAIRSFFS